MSRVRTGHGPLDWRDAGPATPHRFARSYASVPAVTIPEMRPVIHGAYLENRHRVKPQNPLSIHPENRL
jgi:hypothetical protein